jgi:hypothetical protein
MSGELPPWFKFRPAVVFSSSVVQAATRDGELARALFQLMSWNWTSGPIEIERAQLGMRLGVGETALALLEVHGVVRAQGHGLVVASIDWLIEARNDALGYREEQSLRGKASAKARAEDSDKETRTAAQPRFDAGSTNREKENREEENKTVPQQVTSMPATATTLFEDAAVPNRSTGRASRTKRAGETWQSVLQRPEYEPLRRNSRFMEAWQEWIEHCGTSGAEASVPFGRQAVRMLNRARHEPEKYVTAIGRSIEGNYRGVNPDWLDNSGRNTPRSSAPKVEHAVMRAIAASRQARQQQANGASS